MHGARSLLKPITLILCGALLLGLLLKQTGWCLAAALAVLLGWQLGNTQRLQKWLQNPNNEPPQGHSVWGDIFDSLYHLRRAESRERQQFLAVISRMQESTSALREAVVLLDSVGNLEWWNPSTEYLLGLKPQDLGQPVTNLIRHPQFCAYFAKGLYETPLELPSPRHDALMLEFQITQYGHGEHLMLVRNITHTHQLEQMRKDFVANVSHELRTPLTVITGYLETLLEPQAPSPQHWRRALEQMQQQGLRMQQLIDDLLLLARLEATPQPSHSSLIDVTELLSQICQDARLIAQDAHHIELKTQADLGLIGNLNELRSAFSNLIFNAVKYSPEGGLIRVTWARHDQGAVLSVSDNGIGIEAKHLPRLTERFYRVDPSRHSATGGTGLGLAIVKHVLLRHQASLSISSTPGRGSCFRCEFATSEPLPIDANH